MSNSESINSTYEDIVEKYKESYLDEEVVFIKKDGSRLLISLSTLKNNGVYSGVVGYYKHFKGDILFLNDPGNTYYLRDDNGIHIKTVLKHYLKNYSPENVIFSGASMSGYASIDLALHFNANAIVNNPQVNFELSQEYAWNELKQIISNIPIRHNIDDLFYSSRDSVIGAMFGDHLMDKANRTAFLNLISEIPGASIILGNAHDKEHKYYYQGINIYIRMVEQIFKQRQLMSDIHTKVKEL